jgi:branched-chain amino acid transport system ATP-binding protein
VLAVDDLHVAYGEAVPALRGVSFVVEEGSLVALLGANGAGKTTALRAITGLLAFHRGSVRAGTVHLAGVPIVGLAPARIVRLGVGQVLEGRRLFAGLSVDDNLRAGGMATERGAALARRRDEVLELFPALAGRRGERAGNLSGGEQQMLAIGRALMSRPKLLVLDEPSLGLAPRLVADVARIVGDIVRTGTTVLLVEQDVTLAEALADRCYVLEQGRVGWEGPGSALSSEPRLRDLYLGGGVGA